MFVIYLGKDISNDGKLDIVNGKENTDHESNYEHLDNNTKEQNNHVSAVDMCSKAARSYACEFCNESFDQNSKLLIHYSTHVDIKPYACPNCFQTFSHESALTFHTCSSSQNYVCHICSKTFHNERNLKVHAVVHTGERPYVCELCSRSFQYKHALNCHYAKNKCRKKFICVVCEASFLRESELKEHMYAHPPHEKNKQIAKPHVCSICGKRFRHKYYLKAHMPVHTGEKPFKCGGCGRCFAAKGTLRVHYQRFHIGIRPHVCDICSRAFLRARELAAHYTLHTGSQPYSCDICGSKFSHKSSFAKHVRFRKCSTSGKYTKRKKASQKSTNKKKVVQQNIPITGTKSKSRNDIELNVSSQAISNEIAIKEEAEFMQEHFEIDKHHQFKTVHTVPKQNFTNSGTKVSKYKSLNNREFSVSSRNIYDVERYIKKEKAFACELCPQHFEEKKHLYKHYSVHALEMEPIKKTESHVCRICGKCFLWKRDLHIHLFSHKQLKDFVCQICKETFEQESVFRKHTQQCLKKVRKFFYCDVCGKTFHSKIQFEEHYSLHSGEEPFSCDVW